LVSFVASLANARSTDRLSKHPARSALPRGAAMTESDDDHLSELPERDLSWLEFH
jgi:hypothetical protein